MRLAFLFPDDLDAPTGGYAYARRMIVELRAAGVDVDIHPLPGTYPYPDAAALAQAALVLASLEDGQTTMIDGLALGVLPSQVEAHSKRLDLVALVHHPLCLESGIDAKRQQQLLESERAALNQCNRIVTTSVATAQGLVAQFGLPADRVFVAEPGTDMMDQSVDPPGSPDNNANEPPAGASTDTAASTVRLLCVASIVPRKGHLILLEALAGLSKLDWQLDCVGALDRDLDHVAQVRGRITALGFDHRVSLIGALEEADLRQVWRNSDLFVLASAHEGYGMAFAEALRAGLPIIGTTAAVVPQLRLGGARLVAPADINALRLELSDVIGNAGLRRAMAAQARSAAQSLPSWQNAAHSLQLALAARQHVGGIGTTAANGTTAAIGSAAAMPPAASFSEPWLRVRERFDTAARERAWPSLLVPMRDHAHRIRRIVDLGCGTGSNQRYLARRLEPLMSQLPQWLLVDADPALLDAARASNRHLVLRRSQRRLARAQSHQSGPSYLRADLADLQAWPPIKTGDLITASALIDLVSERWLAALVGRCQQVGAAVHLALTYDGRSSWLPGHALDSRILAAFDRDQQTDKGLGPALGPIACLTAIALLRKAGYTVWSARSDWLLDSRHRGARRVIEPLIENHARLAARGESHQSVAELAQWAEQRRRQMTGGRLQVRVGHLEILALPLGR